MAVTIGSPSEHAETDQKLSALVMSATKDMSALVRDEIALAKAELRRDFKQAATGGGLFAVAGMLLLFALIMCSFAIAYGIHAAGIGLAWAWLIVGGGYLLLGAVCGGVGLVRFKAIRGVDATKRTTNESLAVLKRTPR
ncbi:phage holin family protein [Actinocrinis puniceicyclus]|uniref:Phage holin family protein n=1 Tax=Actinocrinis puniceicyclus TaxID=977794 RepID=A0A8J7WKY7_9ACTN|nr:phage holin family protein [Actinocrinis puniceicyclus]MBS2962765.1 phage holin family protein [Actinocrinis puniceicyclus]